jgi:hypothetical protein
MACGRFQVCRSESGYRGPLQRESEASLLRDGWDRTKARRPLGGEGYQPSPFGCEMGLQFRHRPRFPRPRFHPGQSNFPRQGGIGDHGLSPAGLPTTVGASLPAHIHPARSWFVCWLGTSWNIVSPRSTSRHESTRCHHAPRAPFAPSGCYPSGGRLSGHLERHYHCLIAHTGSCARPTPSRFSLGLARGSLQVAASPCSELLLPDVISTRLPPGAWTPAPAGPYGALARFFP